MAENYVTGAGATGPEQSAGEHLSLGRYRAPHGTPRPLIRKGHPARARSAAHKRSVRHQRATVVSSGNPAVVQLEDSDTTVSMPLAQHVTAAMLSAGGTVIAVVFDEANPSDGLIVAAY